MSDDILTSIDGALRDWSVSKDAMRWAPEQREAGPEDPVTWPGSERPTLSTDSADVVSFSWDGSRWRSALLGMIDTEALDFRYEVPDVTETVEAVRSLGRAMQEAALTLTVSLRPALDDFARMSHSLAAAFFPGEHRRCWVCHPWRKPKPLAVDGHAYQRRLRARRRRRR